MTYIISYVLLGVILLFLVVMALGVPKGRRKGYITLIALVAIGIGLIALQQIIEKVFDNIFPLF